MADAVVKPEIKLDPAGGDVNLADLAEFEEGTDLQFPREDTSAWFAKVPGDLWAAWQKIYDSAPENSRIQVGVMRVWDQAPSHTDPKDQKIEMLLMPDEGETKGLAQKYNLKLQTHGYNNTVVFGEKNLPGHSTRAFGRGRYINQSNRPTGISKDQSYNKKAGDYASSIPKQVALAPIIQNEALVSAQLDAASFFLGATAALSVPQTNLSATPDRRRDNPDKFSSFTTSSKPNSKRKKPKEKAVRMDQKELLDAIYRCFGTYKYWKMGSFRRELQQPEAYIKSTLENIADLVRAGDFAGCWKLKPEFANIREIDQDNVKEEEAKIKNEAGDEGTDGGTGDELDEDDLDDMEDIKMDPNGT